MKKNLPTLVTAGVLVVIFLLLLFTFQVRQTQIAVVTNFGRFSRTISDPGFNFRLPWPIQKVYKLENRMQSYEGDYEQLQTRDGKILLVSVFVGWRIGNPEIFLQRFDQGDKKKAEESLENLVRDAKNKVIGSHDFSDLISPDEKQLKFDAMEEEMRSSVTRLAAEEYGVEVAALGIKRIGLPESVTEQVFTRMIEERNVLISRFRGEGQRRAAEIRAEADRERQNILSAANAEARRIEGEADAKAAQAYSVFSQNEKLAMLIMEAHALEEVMKGKTTLILDPNTPPLNLLHGRPSEPTATAK